MVIMSKAERATATRAAILTAAERLFAEHGVGAVSNRQVSEAAGQGNNTAVGYHFGTKADLVRAIVRRHAEPVELARQRLVAQLGEEADLRDWLTCLVRPSVDHLAELGSPTWFARFSAQVMTDPSLRPIMIEESRTPAMARVLAGLHAALPELPDEVHAERGDMARQLLVHMIAERERALADGTPTPRASWADAATGLIDALFGLWHAPVHPGKTP
ncbi:TetR/AcrR family transcriptional regulator [Nocardia sp. NRRL S-836]|uniref:TetR/AcrR family transcriptional regulator n=1 Tax=Nocardia sp. NRRL S-836 TaxID=1519492 RepID=UPI0006ADCC1D|nr:TetR/AcrR family transcriptional regulator [Nocardia sp. NRRL S-836]KOV84530.1 TetR family transcriptional regulator [Nocardia sp. NRRL S-836]